MRVAKAKADPNNTPIGTNLALNENGINASTAWPRTFAYVSASGDLAHHATDGVKDFASGSGKRIWSDWESGVYHTNSDAGVNDADRQPFVATAFGTKGSTDNAEQKKYTVNKVSVGFMEEDGTAKNKIRLPQDYKIEYYSANEGVIPAGRLVNASSGANGGCSGVKGWGADNPVKAYDGWTEVTYIGGKPAVPSADNFKQMADVAFEPVETTAIRITLAPQAENWTGLEEFEVYYEPVAKYDNYEVSKICIDGRDVLADFDEAAKTLQADAATGVITAEATNNASVTVLDAVNGTAKVIFLPENGDVTKKEEYTVTFRQAEAKKTYLVSAEEAEVEMTGEAAEGETVTFSAKEGYEFTEAPVIVRSDNKQPAQIAVTEKNGVYTFVMPAYGVTIRSRLKEADNRIYTVTFDSNGGSAVETQEVPVKTGIVSEPKAPVKRGYDFAGWYSDAGLTTAWNFASSLTGDMTLYAKWNPAEIKVNTEIPAYLIGSGSCQLPEKLNITVLGETMDTAIVWNEADVERLLAATELSSCSVRGTLAALENREITVPVTASPAGIIYFVDSGASGFTEKGKMLADANRATMKNSTPDGAYSESAGWGYTNPDAGLEVNGSGDAYATIRNFKAGNNGKTLTYQFALEAGTYEVTAGFYDPWAQWAEDFRHARVSITDPAGTELAAKADHHISGKESVSFTDITLDQKGSICLKTAPIKSGNDNCDIMISFIAIRKTADFTADKAALASAVAIAERLSADHYTEESYAALLAAVENAKAVLKAGASTAEEVQAQTDAVAAAIAGLKSAHAQENTQLKADLEQVKKDLAAAREQVTSLEEQFNTVNEEKKSLQSQLTAKDTEVNGLKAQLTEKENALATANDRLESLQGQLAAANQEKEALQGQLSQAETDKQDLQRQISAKETEITALGGQISAKETEISGLNGQIQNLNGQLETAKGEKEDLEKLLKKANEKADSLQKDLTAAQANVTALQNQADQLKKEADDAKKQLADAKAEIEKLKNMAHDPAAPAPHILAVGDTKEVKGVKYRVTDAKKKLAEAYGVSDLKCTEVQIAATVKMSGTTCKVTAIADQAFAGMKKLKNVTIGKNVTVIGKKAFRGDKNLVKIRIKSKKLTKVGGQALKGISKNAKIYVPGAKKSAYQKLFYGKGQKKSVKIK